MYVCVHAWSIYLCTSVCVHIWVFRPSDLVANAITHWAISPALSLLYSCSWKTLNYIQFSFLKVEAKITEVSYLFSNICIRFEWDIPHSLTSMWLLGPQLVVLFGGGAGGVALVEEVHLWGGGLWEEQAWSTESRLSLLRACGSRCERPVLCSHGHAACCHSPCHMNSDPLVPQAEMNSFFSTWLWS